jgi:hypothetical protein
MSNNLMLDVPPMSFSLHHNLSTVPMPGTPDLSPVLKEKLKNSVETINLKTHKKSTESPKLEELSLLVESMVDLISVELLAMESIRKINLYLLKNK